MSDVRQEPEDVRARSLVRPVAIGLIFGVLGLLGAWALTPADHLHDGAMPSGTLDGVDRDPIESTARGLDREREARASLDRWEWVDRDAGVARIPIDLAMDLVVAGARAEASGEGP
jgi:hypothetical protein